MDDAAYKKLIYTVLIIVILFALGVLVMG